MKKIYWLIAVIAIIIVVFVIYGAKNGKLINQQTPPEASTKLLFSMETIHETNEFYDIQVEYPKFENIDDLNNKVSNLISEKISAFKQDSKDNWEARKATATPEYPVPENPESPFPFIAEWKPIQLNNNYISFVVNLYYFTGGAHGANEIYAFNYDVKNKKEITMMDFLNSSQQSFEKLAILANQQVTSQLGNETQTNDFLKQMIADGTKATPENYQNFNFNYNSLIIYFQQYQVAPGSSGEITITLYKETLKSNSIESNYLN